MKVQIEKGKDPYRTASRVLDNLNFSMKNKSILIKPNLVTEDGPETGITTDSGVVKAVLERLHDCNIIIGGGSTERTMKAFRKNGYDKLAKKFGARLVDFNDDEVVEKKVPKPFYLNKIKLAKTPAETGNIISVGKLKAHSKARVTLSLKNLFGCVPKKYRLGYHSNINKIIPDFSQLLYPKFAMIDGIVGNQGHETVSEPINSGVVLGSRDALSLDELGCKFMDVDPNEVSYLRRMERLRGKPNLTAKGKKIRVVKKHYKTDISGFTKTKQSLKYVIKQLKR